MSLVPGAQTVHPRETWVDPRFPVFGPLDNPLNNDTVVIHYTAADNLIDGDPGEHAENLPAYIRAMQYSYVTQRGYSLGYLFAVDWLGGIWQIRGWEYQSAANAGHNEHTFPILVLVDGADAATPEAVRSIQLIGAEAQRRAKRPLVVKGHGQLRLETGVGTATACPGAGLQAQVIAGVFNPSNLVTNPPVPNTEEEIMIGYIAQPPADMPGNPPWMVCINGAVRYATNVDAQYATDNQWAFVRLNQEQYDLLRKGANLL